MKKSPVKSRGRDKAAQELSALARMITYARQAARDLDAGLTAHCLDIALAAALEELKDTGIDMAVIANEVGIDDAHGRIH